MMQPDHASPVPDGDPVRFPSGQLVHIAVVDDNTWYREGLGREGGLRAHHVVVARAADADELVTRLAHLEGRRCDVVLLDLKYVRGLAPDPIHGGVLPPVVTQGSPAVRMVLAAAQDQVDLGNLRDVPAVLCYTQENSPRVHLACLVAGAMGVVHKDDPLDQLGAAVDVVATGGCVVSTEVATLIGLLAEQRRLDITESQAQVLALAGHGYSRERIATALCVSVNTVDKHLGAVRSTCRGGLSDTDLADAFGLRDLAPPEPRNGAKTTRRARLRDLSRRLSSRAQ